MSKRLALSVPSTANPVWANASVACAAASDIWSSAVIDRLPMSSQAAIYGGTAGLAFDPCYHQACSGVLTSSAPVNSPSLGAVSTERRFRFALAAKGNLGTDKLA
jgi:hypothetical protein